MAELNSKDLNFIGFLPATATLASLAGILDEDSAFMSELLGLLNITEEIEKAVRLNFALAYSLSFMISEPQNQAPEGFLHTCQICIPVAEKLAPMIATFEAGIGVALDGVRAQERLSERKLLLRRDQT